VASEIIRVAVAGANGRMGRVACAALADADGLTLVGGLARASEPSAAIVDDADTLFERYHPDVLLDLTMHPFSVDLAFSALAHGVRPVIGVSGWSASDCARLDRAAQTARLGAMLVPNFSVGAALMMRFAELAARHFPTVEIVEMHHDGKRDAPSGTARLTAERIVAQGHVDDVPIHSIRLRGPVAHQAVLFGSAGEMLTIRHDSFSRDSFVAGMFAAIRRVMTLRGLRIGLDFILDEME